jgi:hypothetical protein
MVNSTYAMQKITLVTKVINNSMKLIRRIV